MGDIAKKKKKKNTKMDVSVYNVVNVNIKEEGDITSMT